MKTLLYILLGIAIGIICTLWFNRISIEADKSEYSEIKIVSEYSDSLVRNTFYIKQNGSNK